MGIQQIATTKLKVFAEATLKRSGGEWGFGKTLSAEVERGIEECVVRLRGYVLAEEHRADPIFVKVPASWWDHLLLTRCPKFLIRLLRLTPRYTVQQVILPITVKVCPHHDLPTRDLKHIFYLEK